MSDHGNDALFDRQPDYQLPPEYMNDKPDIGKDEKQRKVIGKEKVKGDNDEEDLRNELVAVNNGDEFFDHCRGNSVIRLRSFPFEEVVKYSNDNLLKVLCQLTAEKDSDRLKSKVDRKVIHKDFGINGCIDKEWVKQIIRKHGKLEKNLKQLNEITTGMEKCLSLHHGNEIRHEHDLKLNVLDFEEEYLKNAGKNLYRKKIEYIASYKLVKLTEVATKLRARLTYIADYNMNPDFTGLCSSVMEEVDSLNRKLDDALIYGKYYLDETVGMLRGIKSGIQHWFMKSGMPDILALYKGLEGAIPKDSRRSRKVEFGQRNYKCTNRMNTEKSKAGVAKRIENAFQIAPTQHRTPTQKQKEDVYAFMLPDTPEIRKEVMEHPVTELSTEMFKESDGEVDMNALKKHGFENTVEVLKKIPGTKFKDTLVLASGIYAVKEKFVKTNFILVVVTAEMFEDALRETRYDGLVLTHTNIFPANIRMFLRLPVLEGSHIHQKDMKRNTQISANDDDKTKTYFRETKSKKVGP